MNSVVAANSGPSNAYRARLIVISKKRFLKRCCISVSIGLLLLELLDCFCWATAPPLHYCLVFADSVNYWTASAGLLLFHFTAVITDYFCWATIVHDC